MLRTGWGVLRQREVNALPLLILLANLVGLILSFETGDARLMLVKDCAVGSIVTTVVAFVLSGAVGAVPMAHMMGASAPEAAPAEVEKRSSLAGSTHG